MGNRISISFKQGRHEQSVALFSHWRGTELSDLACEYLTELRQEQELAGGSGGMPLGRLEPSTVMVDFIRWLTRDFKRVDHDLYLGKDGDDGDNSDNGHFVFDLDEWKFEGPDGTTQPVSWSPRPIPPLMQARI